MCGQEVIIAPEYTERIIENRVRQGFQRIYVGENIQRYAFSGCKYIKLGVEGIDYKHSDLFLSPKLLVRKTGLGINACIDYDDTYISQTVYLCRSLGASEVELEYYMGVLNSRVLYYYYLKRYGENEWKSHPYLTKEILFSLPIPKVHYGNKKLCKEVACISAQLQTVYSRIMDVKLEQLIARLYGLNNDELMMITKTLNQLPDLGAINHMKILDDELQIEGVYQQICLDT